MNEYEFSFQSINTEKYAKPITSLCMIPEKTEEDPGIMLFTHGWGVHRFQHKDKMEFVCERNNLICLATEYRQSGFDFNPEKGSGYAVPYDTSFYQVFDVLNALRTLLGLHAVVNRKRIYHYGTSQGGHIALLSGIFAPRTFASIYASSPMTHIDAQKAGLAGRTFGEWELLIRDVGAHAGMIRCPIYLEHGTADESVSRTAHTGSLVSELAAHNKEYTVRYYENGGHDLQPATDKLTAFISMLSEGFLDQENEFPDDFISGSKVIIPCGSKTLEIDWSKLSEDHELIKLEDYSS